MSFLQLCLHTDVSVNKCMHLISALNPLVLTWVSSSQGKGSSGKKTLVNSVNTPSYQPIVGVLFTTSYFFHRSPHSPLLYLCILWNHSLAFLILYGSHWLLSSGKVLKLCHVGTHSHALFQTISFKEKEGKDSLWGQGEQIRQ